MILLLMIVNMLYGVVQSGTRPIVSLFSESIGLTPFELGILYSIYALIPALLAIQLGKWLDAFGFRKMMFAGGSGMLVALLPPIFWPNFATLFISQSLMGISFTTTVIASQKKVGNTEGDLDKLISTLTLTASAGSLFGPLLNAYLYEHAGFSVSFAVSALLAVVAVVLGLLINSRNWKRRADAVEVSTDNELNGSVWEMLKQKQLRNALIISGLVLSGRDLFSAYFPLLGSKMGLTPTMIGVYLSVFGGLTVVSRLCQFFLVRRFGRHAVLNGTLIISGLAYLLLPFVSFPLLLFPVVGVLGAALGLGQPLSIVYTLHVSPPERKGEVLGMRLTFNRGSQFGTPLLFGAIGGVGGLFPIFWFNGALILFIAYVTRAKTEQKSVNSAKMIDS